MALIFDRENKVSPMCIIIDLEMASSENQAINLDPTQSKGENLREKPSITREEIWRQPQIVLKAPIGSLWPFFLLLQRQILS